MRFPDRLMIDVLVLAAAAAVPVFVGAQRGPQKGEWRDYAGDNYGMKYSPLDQITKDNIQDVRVIWRWRSPDRDVQRANPTNLRREGRRHRAGRRG